MNAKEHIKAGSVVGIGVSILPIVSTIGRPAGGSLEVAEWLIEGLAKVGMRPEGLPLFLLHAAAGWFAGGVAATWPDVLESSETRGPNHRKFFHSWTFFVGLGGFGYALFRGMIPMSDSVLWMFILPAIAGYLSHLFLDSVFGKKGLPII